MSTMMPLGSQHEEGKKRGNGRRTASETRSQHFTRLAERAVNQILKDIDRLSRLSATRSNEYSNNQIVAIFQAINEKLAVTRQRFQREQSEGFVMPVPRVDPPRTSEMMPEDSGPNR